MKAYVCDQCDTKESSDTPYGLLPKNWYGLSASGLQAEQHFCSLACLTAHILSAPCDLDKKAQVR